MKLIISLIFGLSLLGFETTTFAADRLEDSSAITSEKKDTKSKKKKRKKKKGHRLGIAGIEGGVFYSLDGSAVPLSSIVGTSIGFRVFPGLLLGVSYNYNILSADQTLAGKTYNLTVQKHMPGIEIRGMLPVGFHFGARGTYIIGSASWKVGDQTLDPTPLSSIEARPFIGYHFKFPHSVISLGSDVGYSMNFDLPNSNYSGEKPKNSPAFSGSLYGVIALKYWF